jgi:hypothetical protein
MSRIHFVTLGCSVIYLFGIVLAMTFAAWLGLDESHFYRTAPVLVPILSTAGIILYLGKWMRPTSWIGFDILAGCSFFCMMLAAGSMGLGGFLDAIGQPIPSNKALGASILTGLLACVFILIQGCVAAAIKSANLIGWFAGQISRGQKWFRRGR